MYEAKENRSPKCSHYVSNSNGRVYPALRNVPGFEDDNPGDWRAATADEIAAHEKGEQPTLVPQGTVQLAQPAVAAAPSTITLATDDEPAAAVASDPPPAPPGAIPTAAPAFRLPE